MEVPSNGSPVERQGELLLPPAWELAGDNVDPAALVELFVGSVPLGGGEAESQADTFDVVGCGRCCLCRLVLGSTQSLRIDEIGRHYAQDGVLNGGVEFILGFLTDILSSQHTASKSSRFFSLWASAEQPPVTFSRSSSYKERSEDGTDLEKRKMKSSAILQDMEPIRIVKGRARKGKKKQRMQEKRKVSFHIHVSDLPSASTACVSTRRSRTPGLVETIDLARTRPGWGRVPFTAFLQRGALWRGREV